MIKTYITKYFYINKDALTEYDAWLNSMNADLKETEMLDIIGYATSDGKLVVTVCLIKINDQQEV